MLAGKRADYSAAKRVVQKAVQWAEQSAELKVAQSVGHSAAQSAAHSVEPLARVCAVGPGCKQAENRNKENPNRRREFQGRIRYKPARMLGG